MMSAPDARTSSGRIALTVAAVPTGMNAGVRISPRCMAMAPVRAAPSVAAMEKAKRVTAAPTVRITRSRAGRRTANLNRAVTSLLDAIARSGGQNVFSHCRGSIRWRTAARKVQPARKTGSRRVLMRAMVYTTRRRIHLVIPRHLEQRGRDHRRNCRAGWLTT